MECNSTLLCPISHQVIQITRSLYSVVLQEVQGRTKGPSTGSVGEYNQYVTESGSIVAYQNIYATCNGTYHG